MTPAPSYHIVIRGSVRPHDTHALLQWSNWSLTLWTDIVTQSKTDTKEAKAEIGCPQPGGVALTFIKTG